MEALKIISQPDQTTIEKANHYIRDNMRNLHGDVISKREAFSLANINPMDHEKSSHFLKSMKNYALHVQPTILSACIENFNVKASDVDLIYFGRVNVIGYINNHPDETSRMQEA